MDVKRSVGSRDSSRSVFRKRQRVMTRRTFQPPQLRVTLLEVLELQPRQGCQSGRDSSVSDETVESKHPSLSVQLHFLIMIFVCVHPNVHCLHCMVDGEVVIYSAFWRGLVACLQNGFGKQFAHPASFDLTDFQINYKNHPPSILHHQLGRTQLQ